MSNAMLTTTALKRWSCSNKQLPAIDQIKRIHVYDFDNTLFLSPLPNKQLWAATTFGALQGQDMLHEGGWWHNPRILSAAGRGIEEEEARGWEGCWNEQIVELARMSAADPEALSVLLTGRGVGNFSELLLRMFAAKGLEFDIVALKPKVSPQGKLFENTLHFKKALLKDIVYTYSTADEFRMYEDRPKHTQAFREFFEDLNDDLSSSTGTQALPVPRGPIKAEVIQVAEVECLMDPVKEVAEVQTMINNHNQAILDGTMRGVSYKIQRTVFYTGYLIGANDTEKLKTFVQASEDVKQEVKWLANNILITPRPATSSILNKVGGMGANMRWKVTGYGVYANSVWAVRVEPVNPNARIYTENHTPCVVLATHRQHKPIEASRINSWRPIRPEQAFEFNTTVGEKVLLRINEETEGEDDNYQASFAGSRNGKRTRDDDFPPLGSRSQNRNARSNRHQGNQSAWSANRSNGIGAAAQRGGNNGPRGRGGQYSRNNNRRGNDRGGGGSGSGGGNRGRGRGSYRSLDAGPAQGYGTSMEY